MQIIFHLDRLPASDSSHNTDYFQKRITHILVVRWSQCRSGFGVVAILKHNSIEFPKKRGERIEGFRDVNLIEIPFRDENGL
jgi:hypothetical protein